MPVTPELGSVSLQHNPGRFPLRPSSKWEEDQEASWVHLPPAAKGRSRTARPPHAGNSHQLRRPGAV